MFQLYQLNLVATRNIGITWWFRGFTVMPQTGEIVMNGSEEKNGRWSLFVIRLEDGKLNKREIKSSCNHSSSDNPAYISSLMIGGKELVAVSCYDCKNIKVVDLQTGEWNTAFEGWETVNMCVGDNGRIFVQSRDYPILYLDSSDPVFKGPLKTILTDIWCLRMCYIPNPVNALVLSDFNSSKMVAKSVEKDEMIWEFREDKADSSGMKDNRASNVIWDHAGLLFHPMYNILLVADGINKRILIVNPTNGLLIQAINLPDMGEIWALDLHNDVLIMLHLHRGWWKIAQASLLKIALDSNV